jgi:dienelactone hydrolase
VAQEQETTDDLELSILGVASHPRDDGSLDLSINTSRGELLAILHPCEGRSGAAVFVGGALGGLDGPADAVYARLGSTLAADSETGLTGLRLSYRHPGEFEECVLDVLAGVSFLKAIGAQRVALVGHSFGGAVVIKAGEISDLVSGVAALSPQLYGTRTVERLAPRSLLLVHGTDDTILDAEASRDIYSRALEPKKLVLYEGAGHGLTQCRDELTELLADWLREAARC